MGMTNYEHIKTLSPWKMAQVIWLLISDYCLYCPKNRERRCNDRCSDGIREWLMAPYIPSSDIWKENRR